MQVVRDRRSNSTRATRRGPLHDDSIKGVRRTVFSLDMICFRCSIHILLHSLNLRLYSNSPGHSWVLLFHHVTQLAGSYKCHTECYSHSPKSATAGLAGRRSEGWPAARCRSARRTPGKSGGSMPNYGNRCCDREGRSTTFVESIVEQVLGKRTVRMQYPMARPGLWNKVKCSQLTGCTRRASRSVCPDRSTASPGA